MLLQDYLDAMIQIEFSVRIIVRFRITARVMVKFCFD